MMENSDNTNNVGKVVRESKKARKLKRQEMIKNYRPSPEREAEELEQWEQLTYDVLETEWR